MIFNRAHIVSFLALSVASVDSFAFTAPSTSGVSSSNNNSVNNCFLKVCENQHYEIKRQSVFLLRSVAEDTGSESTDEAQAEADVSAASTSEDVESDDEVTETAEEESSSSQNSNPEEDITKIAYVVNLSYDTPGYQLREMFTEYGEVQKVFVPKEKVTGKSKGIAFVTMATTEQRDLAIEKMNGVECDGRTIYVDKAKPRSEKGQSSRPDKQGGQGLFCFFQMYCCTLLYSFSCIADNTLSLISFYNFNLDPNSKKLYVGNISYETTKEDIVNFFAEYGEVKDVYIPTDRDTGAPRGFAFVTMVKEEADAAIENLSGVELQGRVIDVKESLPRGQKAPPRERPNSELFYSFENC